jgi:hypothetical protein
MPLPRVGMAPNRLAEVVTPRIQLGGAPAQMPRRPLGERTYSRSPPIFFDHVGKSSLAAMPTPGGCGQGAPPCHPGSADGHSRLLDPASPPSAVAVAPPRLAERHPIVKGFSSSNQVLIASAAARAVRCALCGPPTPTATARFAGPQPTNLERLANLARKHSCVWPFWLRRHKDKIAPSGIFR